VKSNLDSGVPQAIQRMAIAALEGPQDCIDEHNAVYQRRRDRLVEALRAMGLALQPPKASLYVWAKVPEGYNSVDFTADLLDQFERLIGYIKSRDDAVFTDFNAMASAFCSPTASWVSRPTLARLAERSLKRLDYVVEDGVSTSPAEVFGLLVRALACYRRSGRLPEQVMVRPLLGPVKEPVQRQGVKTDGRAVINACVRLDHQLDETGYLPASTPVLYVSLGPGTLLRSMARTYLELSAGKEPPEVLGDLDGPELPEVSGHEYFQEKTFTHDSLYPDGFTGEQVCRYCLWQSWSLKPAVEKS